MGEKMFFSNLHVYHFDTDCLPPCLYMLLQGNSDECFAIVGITNENTTWNLRLPINSEIFWINLSIRLRQSLVCVSRLIMDAFQGKVGLTSDWFAWQV